MKIGVDIVEIERMKRRQDDLATYVLSDLELVVYHQKKGVNQLNYLAGRFAAKEAFVKAMNDKTILFKEVSILNDDDGAPVFHYHNIHVNISISHERHYVVALVIVEEGTHESKSSS